MEHSHQQTLALRDTIRARVNYLHGIRVRPTKFAKLMK
jgi:hypothetical protein